MAVPRLPFLYPNLMRAVKSCEPSTYRSICLPNNAHPRSRALFHTSRRRAQETYQRRYGPAVEPNLPPPSRPKDESAQKQVPDQSPDKKNGNAGSPPEQSQLQSQSQPQSRDNTQNSAPQPDNSDKAIATESTEHRNSDEQELHPDEEEEPTSEIIHETKQAPNADAHPEAQNDASQSLNSGNPLAGVLHMPSPSSYLTTSAAPHNQPPHMAPPPYVHHFDTYSLVQDLAKGGFTDKQSVTIMKAVRTILQNNLDFAKQNLTSKSDVENETYLFKAACSELQSSLQTARNAEVQRQRAGRTSLQHEADILSQRINQELAGLKDDIKGMFNDHKMTVREMQRSIDSSVQELNYKITVSLNSDIKSEIEGLRWILTRRAAMAIATSAFMIIVFLKYYSVRKAQNGVEKKKEPAPQEIAEARAAELEAREREPAPITDLGESLG